MDLLSFKEHVDSQFEKTNSKIDQVRIDRAEDRTAILHLQAFAKLTITIFISIAGFLALAYFTP